MKSSKRKFLWKSTTPCGRCAVPKSSGPIFKDSEKGLTLVLVLSLILLLGLVTVPVYTRTLFHYSNAFRESNYLSALHVAEAGVEESLWNLSYGEEANWEGWNSNEAGDSHSLPSTSLPDSQGEPIGEYEVEVEDPEFSESFLTIGGLGTSFSLLWEIESSPIITCTAGVPDISDPGSEVRIVEIESRPRTVFSLGLFAEETLTLGGGIALNGSPYGANGQIGGNGAPEDVGADRSDVKLPPTQALVNASKSKNDNSGISLASESPPCGGGSEGGDDDDDDGTYTICHKPGTKSEKTMVVDQGSLAGHLGHGDTMGPCPGDGGGGGGGGGEDPGQIQVYDPTTQILQLQHDYTLTLAGGTQENPKVYYFSSIDLNGGNLVTDGYVILLSDGAIDLSDGGVFNSCGEGSADSVTIFGAGNNQSISINTANGFSGAVYAPGANIETIGGGWFEGAVVGKNVTLSANTQYQYVTLLDRVGMLAHYEVASWAELPRVLGE